MTNIKEIWKNVVGYEGKYEVSNLCRVRSVRKILKTQINVQNGYSYIGIAGKTFTIHRLMAIAFIPNPENKPTVNHKDGIKTNNHISNLEWATFSENSQHNYSVLGFQCYMKSVTPYTHHNSKRVAKYVSNKPVAIFASSALAGRVLGYENTYIGMLINGKRLGLNKHFKLKYITHNHFEKLKSNSNIEVHL